MDFELLGQTLKEARVNANFTQSDIAELLNITSQNVSSWERGKSKIDIDSLIYLCEIYKIDFTNLINSVTKKIASESTEVEPEAIVEKRAIRLYEGLLGAGFIAEGQDLTASQIEFLSGVAAIISAFFDKSN